jgi:hypothetical protein
MNYPPTGTLLLTLVILGSLSSSSTAALTQVSNISSRKAPIRKKLRRLVPIGTNLKVRLNDTLSSNTGNIGDRFTVTVLDPTKFKNATLHGHIRSIRSNVSGRTTLSLAFDFIRLANGEGAPLHGHVTRILYTESKESNEQIVTQSLTPSNAPSSPKSSPGSSPSPSPGNENIKGKGGRTGTIIGATQGQGTEAVKRAGIGTTAGAIIGGIAGGGKGAGIGLILGGAGGAGSLAIQGSKELKIESGTEMVAHVTR